MKWIKQTDPNALPGYQCSHCLSLWVTADPEAVPPQECEACGEVAEDG